MSARVADLIFKTVASAAVFCCAGALQAEEIAAERLEDLPPAQIVLLGEVHDNAAHHLNQARALRAFAPAAVVFEMLTPEQAAFVNETPARDAALGAALGWDDSGWPAFALYQPVFEALGSATVYGMAVPRESMRAARDNRLAQAFGPEAARFQLDAPLPEAEQAAREAAQLRAHCDALPADLLPGMVAAQRLRDAAFAQTALKALAETGGPVAVITGTGHVRKDWGMPAAFARAAPDVSVLALGQLEAPATDPGLFDMWVVTAPAQREDPCAAFRDTG